jgi:glycosyltransferase involved in cell wall biosynthesis
MKILQVCPRYPPYIGGVEVHVNEISERLADLGFEVEVLSCDPSGKLPSEETINGVRVKRFNSWAPNESYFFSRDLKKYLKKNSENFDLVHAHSYQAFPALYAAQTKSANKFVFTPHYVGGGGTFFRNLLYAPYRYFASQLFVKANKVICVSKYETDIIESRFKVNRDKLLHIQNGVRLSDFESLKKNEKNNMVILCASRLEKYKGVQHTIKALQKLDEHISLEIIGRGPYKNNLVNLVHSLDLSNRVRFYENLSRAELLQRYASADVFVLVSEREAMPISIVEALAAKTPCIITRIPSLLEWIDEKNCFGIDYPINNDVLVDLLKKVMTKRVEGVKILDWAEVAHTLAELYSSLS